MAEGRRYGLTPQLDIEQILREAKTRWLRASEICEILRNYQRFKLTPDPPYRPLGGSIFLFDRKALRYFRKDGHNWRKKKDGKTVREAHEKLKCGSVDVLHCYYAHGEDNENFQRRSYWLLDGQLEHIVLVHYRDVNEGSRPSVPHLFDIDPTRVNQTQGAQTSSVVCSTHLNSTSFATQASYVSSPSTADWNGRAPSSEFEDADSGDEFGGTSLCDSISLSRFQISGLPGNDKAEENLAGCSGSISYSYPKPFSDGGGANRLFDPYFANQVMVQNFMFSGEQQKLCGIPHRAGSYIGGCLNDNNASCKWPEFLSTSTKKNDMREQKVCSGQVNCSDGNPSTMVNSLSDNCGSVKCVVDGGHNVFPDAQPKISVGESKNIAVMKEENAETAHSLDHKIPVTEPNVTYQVPHGDLSHIVSQFKSNGSSRVNIAAPDHPVDYLTEDPFALKNSLEGDAHNDEHGDLKRLDSFGRWMNKEIGKDCDDSLMASDSCNYWNALDTQSDEKEVSSLSRHMQLDIASLGPSLSQEQLFSILDFAPDWAYSGVETKVLISGNFLGSVDPRSIQWSCMFGEHEVLAEVLTRSVLRCHVPAHAPGRVPFYVTCSNRLACSEIREFEYRENISGATSFTMPKSEPEGEFHLQVRFAKMLSLGLDRRKLACSEENCFKCNLKQKLSVLLNDSENDWNKIENDAKANNGFHKNPRDSLIQTLLKSNLHDWLVCKAHEEDKGPNILDEKGQGAIHLAAALGYDWAISPIITAGVNPSFRDACGRTALHWAAYYGREETVVTLVRLGADPGAVEDPTSKFPHGQTAADLASCRGHKGIAGYLAESHLTSHLSSLTLKGSVMDSVSATLAAEKAVETVQAQNVVTLDGDKQEQLSLRRSLAAVRNSAQAAAQIQAAFRVHSFRQRKLTENKDEDSQISDEAMVVSSLNNKVHKIGHFNESLNIAAVKIQQKYRGWKGRREFLKIRDRIVKIQAHVRGHQVRKQYKKVVWSVGIVEKAILRWRRKGAGLRGFRAENATSSVEQAVGKTDEYEFLRVGRRQKVAGLEKALARVQSMVRYPEARDQYMRLVASSQKSQLGDDGKSSAQVQITEDEKKVNKDALSPMIQ